MPINVFVAGDPAACRECADGLDSLAKGVAQQSNSFVEARWKSESEWKGTAGDGFRDRVAAMNTGASDVAEKARTAAEQIRVLADGLETARSRMRQAADIADRAELHVQSDADGPTFIEDPDPVVVGAGDIDAQVRAAQQAAAFEDASRMAESGRSAESEAHAILTRALEESSAALRDMRAQWYWMVAGTITGYVGTALSEAEKWGRIAGVRAAQLDTFRSIAADAGSVGNPHWETAAARAAAAFEPAADDAARFAAQNSKLLAGATENPVVKFVSVPLTRGEGASIVSKIGAKLPGVGVVITGAQTYLDVRAADDKGDAVLAVAKDTSGFVTGTGATALILAGFAGGPATIAAVGVGALVSWGTGYAIQKMWGD